MVERPVDERPMHEPLGSLEAFGLPGFLNELGGVVIALFDPEDGRVVAANRGFLRLAPPSMESGQPWGIESVLIDPDLEHLRSLASHCGGALLYRGLLTLGGGNQPGRSLHGQIQHWRPERLLLVAEIDVAGLEVLGESVLRLDADLAETQRCLLRANRELRRHEALVQRLMNVDPLTEVSNRRRLDEVLMAEVERSRRHGHPFCVLIANLDRLREVNDRHGRAVGDEVLKNFAALLREHSRQSDRVGRFSGEEFVVLLPDTVLDSAVACAERIRQRLEWQPLAPRAGRVTASFGVAMLAGDERGEELLRRAGQALGHSRQQGRNRVTQALMPGL